jgi:hypothetical protein
MYQLVQKRNLTTQLQLIFTLYYSDIVILSGILGWDERLLRCLAILGRACMGRRLLLGGWLGRIFGGRVWGRLFVGIVVSLFVWLFCVVGWLVRILVLQL